MSKEELAMWYAKGHARWVNSIENLSEHYTTHLIVDSESIRKNIKGSIKYYLSLGVKNKEIEEIDISDISERDEVEEFSFLVIEKLKILFPPVQK